MDKKEIEKINKDFIEATKKLHYTKEDDKWADKMGEAMVKSINIESKKED